MTQYERTYINSELCVALLALYEGTDEEIEGAIRAIAEFIEGSEIEQTGFGR